MFLPSQSIFNSYFDSNKYPDCLNPIMINGYLVPCGSCSVCLLHKKREWMIRCLCEYVTTGQGYFVTLTFDDEHIIDTSYSKVQYFLARLRKLQRQKFRYYGVYENGERSYRPHFHILFFGLRLVTGEKSDNEYLVDIWKNGIVDCGFLDNKSIRYVVGYCQKKFLQSEKFTKSEKKVDDYKKNNKYEPIVLNRHHYHFCSRGLGFSFFFKNLDKIIRDNSIIINDIRYSIPRSFLLALKYRNEELYNEFFSGHINMEYLEMLDKIGDRRLADIEYVTLKKNKIIQKERLLYDKKKDNKYNELYVYRA